MNAHGLTVLDLQGALDQVAGRAASPLGREAVRALRPLTDVGAVARELGRVGRVMEFAEGIPGWGMPAVPDAREALDRIRIEGGVLEGLELHRIRLLLAASRVLSESLVPASGAEDERADAPLLDITSALWVSADLEAEIARTVDEDGGLLDTASRDLKRIRAGLRSAHGRIVRALEGYIGTLPQRFVVEDGSVTIREGRYVIPLRREGRGHVGGVVHDESGTGATIFVEPPIAVDAMNDLRDLERDERRETQRILRSLSARLHPFCDALAASLDALVEFDSLHARARAALEWRAVVPEVCAPHDRGLRLVEARHPLLLAQGVQVVPYDLEMDLTERTLVVSGPNTGGKSVFLKAVGLMALMSQSGVVPPVGSGTVLPVFGDVFADIGDEQSIAESLSTFSAHLENLREILSAADAGSLVLIDEMGTGTDPTEGAALSRAIIDELTSRGCLSVVTSHLGALKTLDGEGTGVVNASLQFDSDRMQPTYRLTKGRPGRSYGLAIARRLGFPTDLLDRAQALVDGGAASLEDLLERLESREREAAALVGELERRDAVSSERAAEVERRRAVLDERERRAERDAREEARKLLLDARSEVEAAIREVRDAEDVAAAAAGARRRVEEAARRQAESLRASRPSSSDRASELAEGSRVRLPGGT
ncbi:MAG: endonuclease MutS2, partial [Gemmatimonadetes bacterium]|nr:endonuclease MutS2 [Gemmatimonadota bacterium]